MGDFPHFFQNTGDFSIAPTALAPAHAAAQAAFHRFHGIRSPGNGLQDLGFGDLPAQTQQFAIGFGDGFTVGIKLRIFCSIQPAGSLFCQQRPQFPGTGQAGGLDADETVKARTRIFDAEIRDALPILPEGVGAKRPTGADSIVSPLFTVAILLYNCSSVKLVLVQIGGI